MRALVQRVRSARVEVAGEVVGAIDVGLLVFVGAIEGDTHEDAAWVARKLPALRIFADENGKMNRSVQEAGGKLLVVSQFTLAADIGKGNRPSFTLALAPDAAKAMIEDMVATMRAAVPVATGRFGADMQVHLVNDGPVTVWLDSKVRGG